jgi:tetratricopeptide (TPR) repeat protein
MMNVLLSWLLIAAGTVEAVWGALQLYGYAYSQNARYTLTGSFYNPGPYSGFLAMTLPLCLHHYLSGKGISKYAAAAAGLLMVSLLPAGMSRSAWIAAALSCVWVYGCHARWGSKVVAMWKQHTRWVLIAAGAATAALSVVAIGLFVLKPASAGGRFFLWKMECRAIAAKPWTGHGIGNFAAAYGEAQESYFAQGEEQYAPWEAHVAGSPEYAFNEYLQLAVETGIPATAGILAVLVCCFLRGVRKRRFGLCGALLSLGIFAFSSYPMQFSLFVVALGCLLVGCAVSEKRIGSIIASIMLLALTGFAIKHHRQAARDKAAWEEAQMLYHLNAWQQAADAYTALYTQPSTSALRTQPSTSVLRTNGAFLFEYGRTLHKLNQYAASTRILTEAMHHSCDPMILNIIGKNHQAEKAYKEAEHWFLRATHRLPGRLYPYYLLAKLYAEPDFRQKEKFEEMRRIVLTKEPKVMSTAVREMRQELEKMR